MPEVHHAIAVRAPLGVVWRYVRSMGNWAALLPGYQSYVELNDRDSVWTLKVDLGPFTRLIELDVQVTEWIEPAKVAFALKSRNEPVTGTGMFQAAAARDDATNISLDLAVDGTGPLAPVVRVMAKPVLDRMAQSFAQGLVAEIERRATPGGAPEVPR